MFQELMKKISDFTNAVYTFVVTPVGLSGAPMIDTASNSLKVSVQNDIHLSGSFTVASMPYISGTVTVSNMPYISGMVSLKSNSFSVLQATHWSPADFTVTYSSSTTLNASGGSFTIDDSTCVILEIRVKNSSGVVSIYKNGVEGISITSSAGVITIAGAGTPFAATDLRYAVSICYQGKAIAISDNTVRTKETYPDYNQYANVAIVTTATSTSYIDMDGYNSIGLQFIQVNGAAGANNTSTQILATMQNDGTAPASCTYVDITSALNTIGGAVSSIATTSAALTALLFDNNKITGNVKYLKVVSTISNAQLSILGKKAYN